MSHPNFPIFKERKALDTLLSPKKQRSSTSYIQLISIRNLILPGEEKTKFEKMNEVSINSLGFGVIFFNTFVCLFFAVRFKKEGRIFIFNVSSRGGGRKT